VLRDWVWVINCCHGFMPVSTDVRSDRELGWLDLDPAASRW
jgi:hypothetical protein